MKFVNELFDCFLVVFGTAIVLAAFVAGGWMTERVVAWMVWG